MNFKQILTVWKKEVKDTVRDRRTLMSMLILPLLLMPLILVGITKFTVYQANQAEKQDSKVAILGSENGLSLVEFLRKQDKISIVQTTDAKKEVKDKKIDAAIEIPADFEATLAEQKPADLKVYGNSTGSSSDVVLGRLTAAFSLYSNSVLAARFQKQKINPSVLASVGFTPVDLSTESERGGYLLSFLIPLFIVMWSLIGGQYTAIDVSAGEKERKTLESLLLTPINRLSLVTGKFLAVATASFVSVVVSLGSIFVAVKYGVLTSTEGLNTASAGSPPIGNLSISLEPAAIGFILLVSVLLILMFSALILSVGIFAKSYREAQSYISPAYLVVILPIVIINTVQGFSPSTWFFVIPVVNASLLFKELLVGTYELSHIAASVASLLVFSALAIAVATIIYSKERILFSD